MRRRIFIKIFTLFFLFFSFQVSFSETKEISELDKGLEIKKRGDTLFEKGDMKGASREYIQAFEYGINFSEEDLLLMAKRVSWAGDLKDAERMLRFILARNSENREAKLHLARVLSWQGRPFSSLEIVEEILKQNRNDKDALFIKANALRYMGRPDRALDYYEKLLAEREDFDIRLAQNYSFLQLGLPSKVHEAFKKLNPALPYQEREYLQLKNLVHETLSPAIRIGYNYFQDSDENEVQTSLVKVESYYNDIKGSLSFYYKDASDNLSHAEAYDLSINIAKRISIQSLLNLGIGFAKGGRGDLFLTGRIGIDFYALRGQMGLNLSRNLLTDTRELIDNQIRVDLYNFYFYQMITDRWIVVGTSGYRSYSDSNKAISLNTHLKYKLNFSYPLLFVGYRFIYLDFDKHKFHGYFDPKDYFSHQLTFTFLYEKEGITLYMEPFTGYQEYKRYGKKKHEWVYGGLATLSKRLMPGLNLEVNLEGGNYAAGTATGWKYYQTGLALRYSF